MQVNTLACDWCPNVTPAVVTLALCAGGKRTANDPALDLCRGHAGTLRRAFAPRPRTALYRVKGATPLTPERLAAQYEAKKTSDRERHRAHARPTPPPARSAMQRVGRQKAAAYWADLEPKVLQAMPNSGTRLSRPEIEQLAGLGTSTTKHALTRLVAQGKVKAHGGRGRYRRYERIGAPS